MKKIVFALLLLGSATAFAARNPGYAMANITSITGGTIDVNGNANFTVEYWYQPCAQRVEKLMSSPVTSEVPQKAVFAVGVLMYDSGVKCAGPTVKRTRSLVINGPFPVGGVTVLPIQL